MDFESYKQIFLQTVEKHFAFLTADYGFEVTEVSFWNISIYKRFKSDICTVTVGCEGANSYVSIDLLSPSPEHSATETVHIELSQFVAFKEGLAPEAKIPPLTRAFDDKSFYDDPINNRDADLAKLADLFKQYCNEILQGDFSSVAEYERWLKKYIRFYWGMT